LGVNNRYMSLWPLPGGWKNYLETLSLILSKIRESKLTLDELAKLIGDTFKCNPEWIREALRICILYTSLARVEDGLLYLTEDGRKFLDTKDRRIVLDHLCQNIWGVRGMLHWLRRQPMTSKELFEKFRELGASWKKDFQVRYRLTWLMALGIIDEERGRYHLTESGLEYLKTWEPMLPPKHEAAQAITGKPSHGEIVDVVCKLGEMLGFYVRREDLTPDGIYRCDVTWRDYEGHRPLKIFEVELSSNVDLALSRLTHAYDVWGSERLYLIVGDEGDTERARSLVEPRVKGAFARIADKLRIVGWIDIYAVYESLRRKEELIRDLAKR